MDHVSKTTSQGRRGDHQICMQWKDDRRIWKVIVKLLGQVWLWGPMDCSLPGSSVHGIFWTPALMIDWDCFSFSPLKIVKTEQNLWNLSLYTSPLSPQIARFFWVKYFSFLLMPYPSIYWLLSGKWVNLCSVTAWHTQGFGQPSSSSSLRHHL